MEGLQPTSAPSPPPTFGPYLHDLESPGALTAAASGVARLVGSHRELILMATGPDLTSVQMTNNSLVSLARLGLREHVMIMADTYDTCERLLRSPHCYWSSICCSKRHTGQLRYYALV